MDRGTKLRIIDADGHSRAARGRRRGHTTARHRLPRGRSVLLLVAALVAIGVTLAMTPSGPTRAPRALRKAVHRTDKSSAHYRLVEKLMSPNVSGNATVIGSGVVDFASGSFSMTLTRGARTLVEVIDTRDEVYVRVPVKERARLSGDRQWVSVNTTRLAKSGIEKFFARLALAVHSDPAEDLSILMRVTHVEDVGHVTVNGKAATAYTSSYTVASFMANLKSALAIVKEQVGAKAAAMERRFAQQLGLGTVPVRAWVGPGGQLRHVRSEVLLLPALDAGTSTVTFSRSGAAAEMTQPPASQTHPWSYG